MEDSEILHDFPPFLKVYKNGHIQRLSGTGIVPPSDDPQTGVRSKDIVISPETGLDARLFLPKTTTTTPKFPLLVYYHGGAFCTQSAFSPDFQAYHTALAAEANVLILSVNYRLAPENPPPICYYDAWEAHQWISSHASGIPSNEEAWLSDHADFSKVYFGGDSAGANIAHNVAVKVGAEGLQGVKIKGIALVHPFFHNEEPREFLAYLFPSGDVCSDPRLNPRLEPNLSKLGCEKVLVCVAEKDKYKERGHDYCEFLKKSGWRGDVKVFETEGEGHVFHLFKQTSEKAIELLKLVASFLNED
ncbi:Alpha/beta hydrolase fold-3 [Dillenia turbinata]|uniref:Alpha/beta hydrolase fold-3 n=1 Tax=Dillenia turbinata TaxID=194707 RepID=A0AAN8WGK2_9MAGN